MTPEELIKLYDALGFSLIKIDRGTKVAVTDYFAKSETAEEMIKWVNAGGNVAVVSRGKWVLVDFDQRFVMSPLLASLAQRTMTFRSAKGYGFILRGPLTAEVEQLKNRLGFDNRSFRYGNQYMILPPSVTCKLDQGDTRSHRDNCPHEYIERKWISQFRVLPFQTFAQQVLDSEKN